MNLLTPTQEAVLRYMLASRQYPHIRYYLSQNHIQISQEVDDLLDLAQGILRVDIDLVEKKAKDCQFPYLLKPRQLQQRVYYYTQHLELQLKNEEFGDYFRGLTPVLVDLLRLLIENDFMPELSKYMMPVVKDTPQGTPLYRGLQWYEKKVEQGHNRVKVTFRKYYGNRFNYDHYVSSSHLLKLIEDHSDNQALKTKANQMRQIEKYLRNIIAHEVVCVDEDLILRRVHMTPGQIHDLYRDLLRMAGLTDDRQWGILSQIDNKVKQDLKMTD